MKKLLIVCCVILAACGIARSQQPVVPLVQGGPGYLPNSVAHIASGGLVSSLLVKSTPGSLAGFNCSAVTGGATGYCVAYNATSVPSTGSLTASLVLDVCYFDTSARGCSLTHLPNGVTYNAGIVILVTSASTPYTYTTGTDTAFISADSN